ncbi:MBL fold metallo-hydrolase [Pseudoalteromonas sp. Hal040]|uniref:MBL fold metallo-hydrolase n=1 Tax=unclassified Pseudoalteromonas TaxID=194690 RepID=UPI00301E1799
MSDPSIEFFPVANGDMTLITTKNEKRILIDCNYRQPSEEVVDVKEMLRSRLRRNEDDQLFIDVFIVTHPDQDHTRGFREIFHTGTVEDWKKMMIRSLLMKCGLHQEFFEEQAVTLKREKMRTTH